MPPEEALPFLGASISVDHDVLVSIAKLRALQLLWARLQELCATPATALHVHAETSRSMLAREDVVDNLLRNTLAAFAAGVGGATSISVLSHTAALGIDDRNARELARNIQHLLMLESDLHRVVDPAAGSGAIEALTDAFAERGWEEFREIERDGGIVRAFGQGQLKLRITKGRRSAAAGAGGRTVTRIPDFPDLLWQRPPTAPAPSDGTDLDTHPKASR